MTPHDDLLLLLRNALWGEPIQMGDEKMAQERYEAIMQLAQEQAVTGLAGGAMMAGGIRLAKQPAMEVYALTGATQQRNRQIDRAVAALCQRLEQEEGIRLIVVKGQTLARHYPDPSLRQSGDIDFIVHPDDWQRAMTLLRERMHLDICDTHSEKHVEFTVKDIDFEMHRMLTVFAHPGHQRYWEQTVMPEIWGNVAHTDILGQRVPVLSPTHEVLYTFVHIFFHLIIEGIGLRQFCDWATVTERTRRDVDTEALQRHLEGIGLQKAYTGLGAVLTDRLGLPMEHFPYPISAQEHQQVDTLMENIWKMGNFGHNQKYAQERGILHGAQHLWRIGRQASRFAHYAPAEAWWRIPYMFKWWGMKLRRMITKE